MQVSDSTVARLLALHVPAGSIPVWAIVLLLVGWFAAIALLILRMYDFKKYAADFPTHTATVIVALAAIIATVPVLLVRIMLGLDAPGGQGDLLLFEAGLAGATVAGLATKRFSAPEYVEAKGNADAARAAAAATNGNSAPQVQADTAIVQTAAGGKPVSSETTKPNPQSAVPALQQLDAKLRAESVARPGPADD